ncbi:MAG TPA: hypothetical protein VGR95_12525 [Thermoanaerobaculia bacterium]|nr:hypothetical protein [Thermoanaerobaculia bacterium]
MPIRDDPRLASFKPERNPLDIIKSFIGDDADALARLEALIPEYRRAHQPFMRQTLNGVLADRYGEAERVYNWGRTAGNLDPDSLRHVSNYRVRLGNLVTLSGTAIATPALIQQVRTFDTDNQIEEDYLDNARTAFRRQQDEQRRRDIERAREMEETRRRRHVLDAHNSVQLLARQTPPRFERGGALVANMVCAVVDVGTGNSATGRAGHGIGRAALEATTGITVPSGAAHAFVVADPTNCAEWEAVYNLMTASPRTIKSDLYFASATPGGGHLIPPCDNCKRWIRAIGARAHGFDQ